MSIVRSTHQHQYTLEKVVDAKISGNGYYSSILSIEDVTVWNNESKQIVNRWASPFDAYFTAMSNDGQRVALAGKTQIAIFDTAQNKALSMWAVNGFLEDASVTLLQFIESKERILVGMSDGSVLFFDLLNQTQSKFAIHTNTVSQLIFQSDASVWSASTDGSIAQWQISDGKILKEFSLPHRVVALDVSNKLMFAADTLDSQQVWSIADSEPITQLDIGREWRFLRQALFVDGDSKLLTASSKWQIWLWDVHSGEALSEWHLDVKSRGSHLLDWGVDNVGNLQTLNTDGVLEVWPRTLFIGSTAIRDY